MGKTAPRKRKRAQGKRRKHERDTKKGRKGKPNNFNVNFGPNNYFIFLGFTQFLFRLSDEKAFAKFKMKSGQRFFLFFGVLILFFLFNFFHLDFALAASLKQVSDTIFLSWPATGTDHLIKFTVVTPIPALGKIVITPQPGQFYTPPLDYTDLRFFVNGVEKTLGNSAGQGVSGVTVEPGLNGKITITLATNLNLSTDDKVQIQIGKGIEGRQIINPANTGSYRIIIETFNNLNNPLDFGIAMIAILEPVQVGTEVIREEPIIKTLQAYCSEPTTCALYGALLNLGTTYWVRVYFEYRIKGTETWNETPKTTTTEPLIFTALLTNLQPDTTYQYRSAGEWLKWDEQSRQFILMKTYGDILEFPTPPPSPPQPPPPPPGVPPPRGVPAAPPPPFPPTPPPYVIFHGFAFPKGIINLFKDGNLYASTTANDKAEFRIDINEKLSGLVRFILQGTDDKNRPSVDLPFSLELDPSKVTVIANLVLAPTIELGKTRLSPGESLEIKGKTVPRAQIEIRILDPEGKEKIYTLSANDNGDWFFVLDTKGLKNGRYRVRAKASVFGESSVFSRVLSFDLGIICGIADLNCDGRVNIIDFSILMFYWGSPDPRADINGDGIVNVIDFSIMMAYWTG